MSSVLRMCVFTGNAADTWHSVSVHHTLSTAPILGVDPNPWLLSLSPITPTKCQSAKGEEEKSFSPFLHVL